MCGGKQECVCVSTLRFECGVSDGGMGVFVERQMCVGVSVEGMGSVFALVERLGCVWGCVCGEIGVCWEGQMCVCVCGGRDMVVWGVCVQMGSLCV